MCSYMWIVRVCAYASVTIRNSSENDGSVSHGNHATADDIETL